MTPELRDFLQQQGFPRQRDADKGPFLRQHHADILAGDVFVACSGPINAMTDYAHQAITAGARAIICDAQYMAALKNVSVPVCAVPALKSQLSDIARYAYGDLDRVLKLIGITGTNGKTSIAYMAYQLLGLMGERAAYIGTLGTYFADQIRPNRNTTPDILSLWATFFELAQLDIRYVALECSSHAIDQGRIAGLFFAWVGFVNFSQDHLDYHSSMEAYFKAKWQLIMPPNQNHKPVASASNIVLGTSVLDCARQFNCEIPPHYFSWGTEPEATYRWRAEYGQNGRADLYIDGPQWEGTLRFSTALGFNFYLENISVVLSMVASLGLDMKQAQRCLPDIKGVPGRLEKVALADRNIFVDYAHTPDAVAKALGALRSYRERGQIICVLGCGGDRDRSKRPLMTQAALAQADQLILTSDNPRFEDPQRIIEDMQVGLSAAEKKRCVVEVDRQQAIYRALDMAQPTDAVLIAGKGHETYQDAQGKKTYFSDLSVALTYSKSK